MFHHLPRNQDRRNEDEELALHPPLLPRELDGKKEGRALLLLHRHLREQDERKDSANLHLLPPLLRDQDGRRESVVLLLRPHPLLRGQDGRRDSADSHLPPLLRGQDGKRGNADSLLLLHLARSLNRKSESVVILLPPPHLPRGLDGRREGVV